MILRQLQYRHLAIALAMLLINVGGVQTVFAEESKPATQSRQIVDMAGRHVAIPGDIKNAACLLISSYEKMLLLGQGDKIKLVMRITSPWATKIFPSFVKSQNLEVKSAMNPNLEDMMANNVDVVFFWNRPEVIQKMATAGIPVVVTQIDDRKETDTLEAFIALRKKEMSMHADIFGAEAQSKADAWNRYFEEKVNYVYSRTKLIPDEQRLSAYYVRGPDVLTTHSKYSHTWWDMKIAGANPVASGQTKDVIDRVPAEQFLGLNPDVIFMGWLDSTDLVLKDEKWKHLNAVVNGKVFISPNGVYRWDHSSEAPLLIMFFAKTLYPALFPDLDLVAETKNFYSKFYSYELTDDEAQRILSHRPPADRLQ